MKTPPPCNRKIRKDGSRKLLATGRWGNVPGKVQISMQSHSRLWNIWENTREFHETSRNEAMGESSRKGSILDASHKSLRTWEIARQFLETSRNGAMEKRSGKGSNLPRKVQMLGSFIVSDRIRVNVAILKLDSAGSPNVNTSSL
jgi:hypothetical protein